MAVSRGLAVVKSIRPTLDTSAYASGDVLFQPLELPNFFAGAGCCSILESVHATDLASQSTAIDLYFFSKAPASSVGANNAAFAPVDADMVFCVGKVSIAAADFAASGANNSTATKAAIGQLFQGEDPGTGSSPSGATKNKSVWVVGVCRSGTPTYAATDLVFKIGALQE